MHRLLNTIAGQFPEKTHFILSGLAGFVLGYLFEIFLQSTRLSKVNISLLRIAFPILFITGFILTDSIVPAGICYGYLFGMTIQIGVNHFSNNN